ncbi:cytochrome c oxidase assembly protein [Patulibacter sp.]|uniref:cytochrome c oxidase assembly protein n=1 Tax=Patulibacter sp. TaxID=1912859 RepID=UPI00271A6DC8|nr:cytochrome c oxidase assembly protein [Patulibacter sp.]MDO9410751.1 cytochrome c oxidase assembly protein [Patulibacter sp.]
MSPPVTWGPELAPLLLAAILWGVYIRRWITVRRSPDRRHAPIWRLVSFFSGGLVLVVAQGNPIDGLGDYLLVMHMVQHLLLLDVFPLLLLFGLNRVIMRPITRRVQWIEQRIGFLATPWFGLVGYTLGMWIWHVPALYNAASEHTTVHLLEHMTFTAVGFLYWWHLLRPIPGRDRMTAMGPMAYMGVTKVTVGLLGMALTFAPKALYDFYSDQPTYWGLSAVADQGMAGALMATEQVLIMGVAFGVLFMRGLRESEQQAVREERLMDRAEAAKAAAAAREAEEQAAAEEQADADQRAADTGFMRI